MQSNVRVGGSNYTTFRWQGQPIAYLTNISDSGQSPVAQVEEVHPLGSDYPVEFAVPNAMSGGRFTLTIEELWNKPVWQHLAGLATANNLLDVWRVFRANPAAVTAQTIIKPPTGGYWRTKTYHNVVIVNIDDSETVNIGTMTMPRVISCAYTHATRGVVTAGG